MINFGQALSQFSLISMQCWINNSSNCYGPAFLCITFVLYYLQGWILELGARGKLSGRRPIFYTCYTLIQELLFVESKFKFSFYMGIRFCLKVHCTL